MKEKIGQALLLAVGAMIGLIIINIIDGKSFDCTRLILSGFIIGVIDFLISMIGEKIKNKKTI